MASLRCDRCMKPYSPSQGEGTPCPRCGRKPRPEASPLGALGARLGERLRREREALARPEGRARLRDRLERIGWLPPLERRPDLRRCPACHFQQFSPRARCLLCGALAVELELAPVYSGRAVLAEVALARHEKAWRIGAGVVLAYGLVVAISFARLLLDYGPLGVAFWGPILLVAAAGGHVLLVAVVRAALRVLTPEPAAEWRAALESLEAKLERICDELVFPFFERNGIAEGAPVRAPGPELELLRQALSKEAGVEVATGAVAPFLTACAFRRDYVRFVERLEAASAALDEKDPVRAYAACTPPGKDEQALPLLRKRLAEDGRTEDGVAALRARIGALRKEERYRAFLSDLEERRRPEAPDAAVSGAVPPGPPPPAREAPLGDQASSASSTVT